MKKIVVIPTYNERENLADIVRVVLEIDADNEVLVVDDASPDGTGRIADELCPVVSFDAARLPVCDTHRRPVLVKHVSGP